MRADEYVVEELKKTQTELSNALAANIFLRQENREIERKYNLIKSLFYVEETTNGDGYRLCVKGIGYTADSSIAYAWTQDVSKIDKEFLELVDALGLILPSPTKEDLETDPELVEQAMEKVKELQAENESEEK